MVDNRTLDAVKYIGLIYGILSCINGLYNKKMFPKEGQGFIQISSGFLIILLSIGLIVYTEQKNVEEDDKTVVSLILPILAFIMASDLVTDIVFRKLTYRYKVLIFGIIIALMISYPLIQENQKSATLNAVLFMFLTFILLNVSLKDSLNRIFLKGCDLKLKQSSFGKSKEVRVLVLNELVSLIMPIIYAISLLVLYSR